MTALTLPLETEVEPPELPVLPELELPEPPPGPAFEDDDVREEYQQNPEHFMALVVGIDEKTFHYINQQNETAIDEKSFLAGESCLLCHHTLIGQFHICIHILQFRCPFALASRQRYHT